MMLQPTMFTRFFPSVNFVGHQNKQTKIQTFHGPSPIIFGNPADVKTNKSRQKRRRRVTSDSFGGDAVIRFLASVREYKKFLTARKLENLRSPVDMHAKQPTPTAAHLTAT